MNRFRVSVSIGAGLVFGLVFGLTTLAQEVEDQQQLAVLPKFSAVTITGDVVNTERLRGKVVLLDFWVTWCKPCQAAVPRLKKLARELEDEPFVIVGLASETNLGKVRSYTEARGMTWPQILDPDRRFSRDLFQVASYPTYILVDRDGSIIFRASGFSGRTEAAVERAVRKALRDKQGGE